MKFLKIKKQLVNYLINRMKILIISSYYKPGYKAGGPIQSVYNMSKLLGTNLDICVLTMSNDMGEDKKYDVTKNIWLEYDQHHVKYIDKEQFSLKKILEEEIALKPDYIYFNSLFSKHTYQIILHNFYNKLNAKIIIAPRGELDPGALKIKKLKKKVFLTIFNFFTNARIMFHATTITEKENIARYFKNDIVVAENVPNLIIKKPEKPRKEKNQTNFVFISRITPKKNLKYCIDVFSQLNFDGEINFDIIGPLEDKEYWSIVEEKIKFLNNKIKVNYIGEIPNNLLLEKTKKYHYLFFPTLAENYGHIIYESLSYGIPVIISNQTPWKENNNGVFVRNLENNKGFLDLILNLHSLGNKEYIELSKTAFIFAQTKVNITELTNSYKKLFNEKNSK